MRFEDLWPLERGTATQREAADLLGVGERQVRRQCRRYESDDIDGFYKSSTL
jgi:transposase